jgi:hypothetical protein
MSRRRQDALKVVAVGLGLGLGTVLAAARVRARRAVHHRSAEPDLAQLTKDELYRRAKQAGIRGRSTMSKDELIRALRRPG